MPSDPSGAPDQLNAPGPSDAGGAPETRALRALQSAAVEAEQALGRRLGLAPNDLAALGHVTFAPDALGAGELTARLGLSAGAGSELVDRLERAGHLERARDARDRRRVRLTASESARREVLAALAPLLAALDALPRHYDDVERAAIVRFLEQAAARYRAYAAGAPDADPPDAPDADPPGAREPLSPS